MIVVLTRACTALAALVLHLVTESWPNAVSDIVTNFETVDFPNVSMEDKCTALLEILTVIPEEFQTSKMEKNQLRQVRAGIKSGSKCVLDLFLQLIRSGQSTIVERSIKALASWLDLDLPLDQVVQHIELCFDTMKTPKYFEVSGIVFHRPHTLLSAENTVKSRCYYECTELTYLTSIRQYSCPFYTTCYPSRSDA